MGKQKSKKRSKALDFDPLISSLKENFDDFVDSRGSNKQISLGDCLQSGLAMFSLKDASLLSFNNSRPTRAANLSNVYKISKVPSDSHMRTLLDKVKPISFSKVFTGLVCKLRLAGFWKKYIYFQGYMICSVDGVHHFSSEKVHCKSCMKYTKSNGVLEYRHYLLSGSIVHPDKKEVMPVIHEPILRVDGQEKNDCERNAGKRLLPKLRKLFPKEKLIIVEDALSSNGPHIKALQAENFRFVLGVKPDGNKYLFDLAKRLKASNSKTLHYYEEERDGFIHQYEYVNNVPLNSSNRDVKVNFLNYRQIDPTGKKKDKVFSWVTDFKLRKTNLYSIMRIGRSRWKIENECFNTLKNQSYNFEHNYGHGKENLCMVLVLLMMLAFWIDQIQQANNSLFILAWKKGQTRIALWEKVRSKFNEFVVQSMEIIYKLIIGIIKVKSTFYNDSG